MKMLKFFLYLTIVPQAQIYEDYDQYLSEVHVTPIGSPLASFHCKKNLVLDYSNVGRYFLHLMCSIHNTL